MSHYLAAMSLMNQLYRNRDPQMIRDDPDLHRALCLLEVLIIVNFARSEDPPFIPPGDFSWARALDHINIMLLFNPPDEERFILETIYDHIRDRPLIDRVPEAPDEPVGMLSDEGGFGFN